MEMIELIRSLPKQIEEALIYEIPKIHVPKRIFLCGMGGSAIAGDLAKVISRNSSIPIEIIRDYNLPSYASKEDLLIALSYSGDTEETLSCFKEGAEKGLALYSISSGGKLKDMAKEFNGPHTEIPKGFPPRTALGYLITPIICLFHNLGLISEDEFNQFKSLPNYLYELQKEFEMEDSLPLEIATKLYKRIPVIYTSTRLNPIALRWKAQINENSKGFCHTMEFPEMNHNEINGIKNPITRCEDLWALFLVDEGDHERIKLRFEITRELIEESIQGYTKIQSKGENFIHRIFYLVYLGDYVSLYLARFYNEDPIAIPRISELKRRLSQ